MSVTSAAGALCVAYVPERVKLHWRWVASSVVLILGAAALPAITEIWQMVVLFLVTGVGVGPMLVTMFSIGAQVAPPERLTTVMAMLSSGIIVGQAIAAGVSGTVAGTGGYPAVATLVVVAASACLALSLANARVSRR